MKKVMKVGFLLVFLFMFATTFVMAASVDDVIANPNWLVGFINFLKLGTSDNIGATWADFIVALAVLLLVFAVVFEVLSFTAFETPWVKYSVAVAVAVLTAIFGGINWFAEWMLIITGDFAILAVGIVIVVALAFFIGGSFFKGRMKAMGYKSKSDEVEGLMTLAAKSKAGDLEAAAEVLKKAHKEKI